MTRRRTTLYAAFTGKGVPVINVYSWDAKALDVMLADRLANGDAFPDEHRVRCTIEFYRRQLEFHGFPVPREFWPTSGTVSP